MIEIYQRAPPKSPERAGTGRMGALLFVFLSSHRLGPRRCGKRAMQRKAIATYAASAHAAGP
jgi:hypothetical protein